jgi:hypothetical protein
VFKQDDGRLVFQLGFGLVFNRTMDQQRAVFKGIGIKKLTDTGFWFFFRTVDFLQKTYCYGFSSDLEFWIDIAINQLLPQK